jgi:DNA-binding winged helix-turn-helix (wHTH) protein
MTNLQRLMNAGEKPLRLRFGGFTFDAAARSLRKDGQSIGLSDQMFDTLHCLLRRRPYVVLKDEFLAELWPGDCTVGETNLAAVIKKLRDSLDDSSASPRFIKTHFGKGYSFDGEVVDLSSDAAPPVGQSTCWLVWDAQRLKLYDGENVVGRDPQHRVFLDHPSVSRTHAAIRIHDSITIEDRGSRYGTFLRRGKLREVRIASSFPLQHGDKIRFGATWTEFRTSNVGTVLTADRDVRRSSARRRKLAVR